MVKLPFWFTEFRKMINLLNAGLSFDEIRTKNSTENIFSASSEARAVQLFNTVSRRVKELDQNFYDLFCHIDVANQKLVLLIAIMKEDSLFFDFMYEVFREKLILGTFELSDSDFSVFFRNKQVQSDRVAGWTDETLARLTRSYKTVLSESGLLGNAGDTLIILRPVFDPSLELLLTTPALDGICRALTGVN